MGKDPELLLFLQSIRDESHRFVISFHRKRRSMHLTRSVLDTIPGIGKTRKSTLLRHFDNVAGIRTATEEDLRQLPGFNRKVAQMVLHHLNP